MGSASITETPKVESSQVKSSPEELVTRSPMPAKKVLSHPLVFRNRGRGLSARGGLASRGRVGLSGRGKLHVIHTNLNVVIFLNVKTNLVIRVRNLM